MSRQPCGPTYSANCGQIGAVGLDGVRRSVAFLQRANEPRHRLLDDGALRACSFALPCPALAARMMLFVHAVQPVEREMGVHLRGRDVGVPEDGLHRAQVGAVLHHVRRATMTQHVRTGVPRRLRRGIVHHLPHALPRDVLARRAR